MMNTHKKPIAVMVFAFEGKPGSNKYDGFARKLQAAGGFDGYDIVTVALENLAFCILESGEAEVIDTISGTCLGDAAFVYLKSWESLPEEAGALAQYLHYSGVPFMDLRPLGMGYSKLAASFRHWGHGLTVPTTIYVRRSDRLLEFLNGEHGKLLGERFIAKDILAEKGRDNYLLSLAELNDVVAEQSDKHFMGQRFVPNDGDYRVGVYAGTASFAIKRMAGGTSHLNNVSAGGHAELIPIDELPEDLRALAEDAAEASELQVAGVDLIVDKKTKQAYVLEVNQGSQIVSGAYTDENISAFNSAMKRAMHDRYALPAKTPRLVIGRLTAVSIPEMGIAHAIGKVDTGAYSSTLHAENIHLEEAADGTQELVFDIPPRRGLQTVDGKPQTVRYKDFFRIPVRSSNGIRKTRYGIMAEIHVRNQVYSTEFTLSDRTKMEYPMLLGRRLIRSRFLVNVELNEKDVAAEDEQVQKLAQLRHGK